MALQQVTRISVLISRRPDISEEAFHRYWANNHGPLVQDMLVQYGIIKYTQARGDISKYIQSVDKTVSSII
jgi:EthD domain